MGGFLKCRQCGIPLNREIVSKKDPNLCFECAEERRAFTPSVPTAGKEDAVSAGKK